MKDMSITQATVKPYSLFFQALANRTRMQILQHLRENGRKNVSEICKDLGLEQTLVSHNLRCLAFCGMVNVEREGKSRMYSITYDTITSLLKIVDLHLKRYASNLFTCDALER